MAKRKLRVFTSTFKGVYIGGSAVIVADNEEEAYQRLCDSADENGIKHPERSCIQELDLHNSACYMLDNGDY